MMKRTTNIIERIKEFCYIGIAFCLIIAPFEWPDIEPLIGAVLLSAIAATIIILQDYNPYEEPEDAMTWNEGYDPDYVERLKDMPEDMRKAYLMGDPEAFELNPEHEWIDPDKIIYRKFIPAEGYLVDLMQNEQIKDDIRALIDVMEAAYHDPVFAVYDENNELIASLSPFEDIRIRNFLKALIEVDYSAYKVNLEDVAKYQELIGAVKRKFPGESRHETALRYIRRAEDQSDNACREG